MLRNHAEGEREPRPQGALFFLFFSPTLHKFFDLFLL